MDEPSPDRVGRYAPPTDDDESDGTAVVSPAYDVAMHLHHDRRDPPTVIDINGEFHMDEITMMT